MTELLEKIDGVYAILNELDAIDASKIEDQEFGLDGYARHAAALFEKSTKAVEEICREILLHHGETQWAKPHFGLPILIGQLYMTNIAPREIQYKLDFFISMPVIDGEGLAKKLARIKDGREAIDMLKSVVENAPNE